MENKELSKNIANATKWSTVTEFVAKIFIPVTNMILARLLTPELWSNSYCHYCNKFCGYAH